MVIKSPSTIGANCANEIKCPSFNEAILATYVSTFGLNISELAQETLSSALAGNMQAGVRRRLLCDLQWWNRNVLCLGAFFKADVPAVVPGSLGQLLERVLGRLSKEL